MHYCLLDWSMERLAENNFSFHSGNRDNKLSLWAVKRPCAFLYMCTGETATLSRVGNKTVYWSFTTHLQLHYIWTKVSLHLPL